MKNTKRCPKCKSTDIIIIVGSVGAYGAGNNIPIGWPIFTSVLVNRYLCCGCGYSEEWINREDIPKLEKRYKRSDKSQ